jgi:hypothetical protein
MKGRMTMSARNTLWAAVVAAAALSGCASPPPASVMLTYETRPEGATLYEGGQPIGVAPVMRSYPGDGKSGSIRTPLVTAVWPSGAKESYYTILPLGSDRVATIERPAGAPGLQADLDHAKQLALARERDARRNTDATLRDQRRNSERCKRQQAGGSLAVQDDC